MGSLTIELVFNASGELFPDKTLSAFTNFFTRTTKLGGTMGGCNFRKPLPINVPKYNGGEIQVFWQETFKFFVNLQSRTWAIHIHHRHCGSNEYADSRKNNHNETCITVKVSRRTKKIVIMLANDTSGLAFCSTDLGHIFGNNLGNEFGVLMIGNGPH